MIFQMLLMKPMIFGWLSEGGPLFMYSLLILLMLCIATFFYGLSKNEIAKYRRLLSSLSLFALVFGFLGHMIGLLSALSIMSSQDISAQVLAGGLRVSLQAPLFGLIIFLISRIGIIYMDWRSK